MGGRSSERASLSTNAPVREGAEPGAALFVWTVWGVAVLAALGLVAGYGARVPIWDDFDVIPVLAGEQPMTLDWLWSQHNEHRIPLPRLILLAAYRLSGYDFRAGMFVSVGLLGAMAGGLIAVAGRVRGGAHYSDAFLALALLQWGLHANLLWSIQVCFVLTTALAGLVLGAILLGGAWPGLASLALAATALALLPLCGANGVALVPGLLLWFGAVAVSRWRTGTPRGRRDGVAALLLCVPAVALTAAYFHDYARPPHHAIEGGIRGVLATSLQFLSVGFGPAAAQLWPWSGWVTLGLLASTIALLAGVASRRRGENLRALGLLAFLAAHGALALGLGWGRASAGALAGMQDRYVALAVPWLCSAYLAWSLYGTAAGTRLVGTSLAAAACALLWPNTEAGLEHGRQVASQAGPLVADLRSGMPAYRIIKKYGPLLHPSQDELARFLPILRRGGFGPFRFLRDNPPFREMRLPPAPTRVALARWEGNTAHVTGVDPQLAFTLAEPRYVAGIRLRYSHANRQGTPARFQLAWKRPGGVGYLDDQRYSNWNLPTGQGKETTLWIDDVIDEFRIQPDNQPCEFRIDEIVLLVR